MDPLESSVIDVSSPASNVLIIDIKGRMRSKNTFVYRADPFDYWSNLTFTPTLMEYTGERYLIRKVSNNCVKAIKQPSTTFVSDRCEIENFEDNRLKPWHKKKIATDLSSEEVLSTNLDPNLPMPPIDFVKFIRKEN